MLPPFNLTAIMDSSSGVEMHKIVSQSCCPTSKTPGSRGQTVTVIYLIADKFWVGSHVIHVCQFKQQ